MIGKKVGHYRLEAALGRGGFGAVYRGVHAHLEDIQVAVKVFHPELAKDPGFVKLLRRECQVLHSLSHPGIVAFRDLVVEEEVTAIVLELLEGRDLNRFMRESEQLAPEQVAELLKGILVPLAHGHQQGIVHRDIKPSNVFLCDGDSIKLMDFGIAKATQTTTATQSSMMAGTLDYMSVERFRGESPLHSDVYAVGLVGWELLAGRKACPAGDIPAKIGWHHSRGAPDVRSERPETPSWLAELLLALAAKDAKRRPLDASKALDLMTKLRGSSMPSSVEPSTVDLAPETWQAPEVSPLAAPTALEPVAPQPAPVAPPGPVLPSPAPVDPAKSVRPSAQRKARRAGPRPASSPIKKSGRRFPWATLLALLVAFAVGGFILHRIMQGH